MFPLVTNDLCIRPFQEGDVPAFVAAVLESVSTVGVWFSWCNSGFSIQDATSWISSRTANLQSGDAFDVGAFSEDGSEFLGGIAINHINKSHNMGNVGYWVPQSRQGQGIATRAVQSIIQFGFSQLLLTRLEIVAAEMNIPSRRVAEKVGAMFECIARNRVLVHGLPQPAAVYSLVSERCGF